MFAPPRGKPMYLVSTKRNSSIIRETIFSIRNSIRIGLRTNQTNIHGLRFTVALCALLESGRTRIQGAESNRTRKGAAVWVIGNRMEDGQGVEVATSERFEERSPWRIREP